VVVWSTLSVESRWVRSEAHEGLERECLIPVTIEGAKAPIAFKLIQGADLTHWRGDAGDVALGDVLAGVRRIVGKSSPAHAIAGGLQANQRAPQVTETDRKSASDYTNTGVEHLRRKDYDRAIADLTKAIELDPRNAWSYDKRGEAYVGKNDYDRAITDFTKSIEMDPKRAYSRTSRGRAYFCKNDFDQAIADYSEAIEIDAKYAYAFYYRGDTYLERRNYDLAIADYAKAIEIRPDEKFYYYLRGRAYRERQRIGDRDRASADFRRALEIDPEYRLAQRGLQSVGGGG
jgi:tetratricopeptide (TPR) repeat protein